MLLFVLGAIAVAIVLGLVLAGVIGAEEVPRASSASASMTVLELIRGSVTGTG